MNHDATYHLPYLLINTGILSILTLTLNIIILLLQKLIKILDGWFWWKVSMTGREVSSLLGF